MAAASPAPTPTAPEEDVSPAAQARKTRTQKAMKKARRKFGFVSGLGSSGVRTEAGQREDVGFWKGLKNAKRRVSQKTLAKLGYGKETEDEYYIERKKRIVELQGRYERLSELLAQYTDAARSMCSAASEIANEMNNLFARCPPEFTTVLTTLTGALTSVDKDVRREMDEVMTEQVIAPMEALGDLLDEVRVDCHSREYLKVDYDAHHRQSTNLKSKPSADTAHLSKVERKELADRRKLSEATKHLVDTFDEIESKRWNVVLDEMNTFVNIQKQFFQRGSAVMNAIQNFPPGGAVAPIPATYAVSTPFGPIRENGRLPGCDYLYDGGAPPEEQSSTHRKFGALSPSPEYPAAQPAPIKTPQEVAAGKPASSPGGGAVLSPSVAAAAAASSRRRSSVDGGGHKDAAARAVAASSGSARGAPPPPPVKRQAADRARALYAYAPANADELAMSAGDVIAVSKRHDDGWGEGENESNGQRGMFPLNYVQTV